MEDKGFIRCFSTVVQHGVLGWIIYGALIAIWPINGKQCYFSAGMRGALPKVKTPLNFEYRPSRQTMEGLYELKRELLLLEGAITPIIDICKELMRFHNPVIPKEGRVYFRDIADHVKRIDRTIHGMREMLVAAMQVHLTFETVRQNEVVKRLAGWGAILAIPTMVFSWYGMNFRHMPELDWQYSYPVVVGGVALGSLLLYLRLKRTGWL
jgi:magnesium transporter